ncbi:MAG TPA: cytidylate kinase family protein [Candidatus Didemnitutus sp.]|jgi:cytidylate kinase
MNASLFLERADGFFHAESRSPWGIRAASARPFVTISRESGSGGSSLAALLAARLTADPASGRAWAVFEGNLPAKMLQANHLSDHLARFLPEDHVSELHSSIGELLGLHPSLWELVQKMNQTMRDLAEGGNVILVGRGANFATAGNAQGMHVRLVAPDRHRARVIGQRYGISEAKALVHNVKCTAARRRYVRDNFNADLDDPSLYDLVINTGQISLAEAADLIAMRIRARVALAE